MNISSAPAPMSAVRLPLRDGRQLITHDESLRTRIQQAAKDALPVLVIGETGSGKDLVAHLIHELGPRRDRPFVIVDCATLCEGLAETELFGAARGAFSGAIADRAGLVAAADGGTLFLDEFPELSLTLQAKLLRFLADGGYRRVGENRARRSQVRVVAATNRDPEALLTQGRLRPDVFFRLNGHRLRLSSLRERPEDIVAIAEHLVREAHLAGIRPAALRRLQAHPWPGNVRELEMELWTAAARTPPGGWLEPEALRILEPRSPGTDSVDGLRTRRAEAEREILVHVLSRHGGNIAAAARELCVSRQALHQALRKSGILQSSSPLPG